MKKFFFIIFAILLFACNRRYYTTAVIKKDNNYCFIGKIIGMDSGWLYLLQPDTTGNQYMPPFDSTIVINGFFRFEGHLVNPQACKVSVKPEDFIWPYTSYFILDTGITTGELFKDSMANSIIKGGDLQKQFVAFNLRKFKMAVSYGKEISQYKKEDDSEVMADVLWQQFAREISDLILKEVKAHPYSFASAFIAYKRLPAQSDIKTIEDIYNTLKSRNNYYAKQLSEKLKAKKQTLIGLSAPDFKLIDDNMGELTNKTFKGKYLLLDFWASWCKPCREENHNLVTAYRKYADKGLEIVSISLDRDKSNWEEAVKYDNLSWIQLCDLKGSKSKIAQSFGIEVIPSNFLINKEGKIVAKDLTGSMLDTVLGEHLLKK